MSISPSPSLSLSPLRLSSNSTNLPLVSTYTCKPFTQKRHPVVVFSYRSGTGLTSEDREELLKRYGLDPDEFLSEPSSKTRRKKEVQRTGRGAKLVQDKEPREQRTTHKLLQVLGGKARRKKLLSPKGMDVRPMMEVVKGAAFDILQVAGGSPASLRPGRWLDLYSGTGSVGIEAISRGCSEVHFVEMDPWVVSNVLKPNLEWTGFLDVSYIHTIRVENFIERAEQFVGKDGAFDYISVTPPYTAVDYGVLMGEISKSALVGKDTFIVVEYPLRTDMLDSCGCLVKIKDRRFGRTHLAIYGPEWAQKKRKSD
ncbi:Methyltransferase [Melia azedarach]|uniref:Methyltransferase n=1 Tax=Melia azedarach TaxID=155640 RepID=A0ACC1X8C8_MELAZ|nr:Methyltransferase [Melia azedarach]